MLLSGRPHWRKRQIASFRQTRRSPRAIRTSRNCTRENRETSSASIGVWVDRIRKPKAQSGHVRRRGVELGHSTREAVEQSGRRRPSRRRWREGPRPRRTPWNLTLARHRAGPRVIQGLRGVRERASAGLPPPGFLFRRQIPSGVISKVRTVCSSSCKYGSVRGVAGNSHPYRDGFGIRWRTSEMEY